jgi:hypothetical protein
MLPPRWRLRFFAALSIAGIAVVLDPATTLWVIAVGSLLIWICHWPLSWRWRIVLLLAAGVVLALMRAGQLGAPWSGAFWPVLGSMFMFRLISYVHDRRHQKTAPNPWRALSYFFLLPNVCFPLFPVVDYTTFRRTYYNKESIEIYQNGVRWMVRGLTHLMLYRLIYQNFSIAPADITRVEELVRFVVSNYLLYLRVSGQFHFIVGMLQLFGFNLPETHHRYYLAGTFNDFWRRINIYWKDFMMKTFYYPAFFKMQKLGATTALVLSTVVVFALTWMLHSYQWFWLLGSFPITWQDGVFWSFLCIAVVANSLIEFKSGKAAARKREIGGTTLVKRGLQTAGFFVFMAVLWSMWTSESADEWLGMWHAAANGSPMEAWWLPVVLAAIAIGAALEARSRHRERPFSFGRSVATSAVPLALLGALALPAVTRTLDPEGEGWISSLSERQLNIADETRLQRGYYEKLTRVERFGSRLWELYAVAPTEREPQDDVALLATLGKDDPVVRTDSFLRLELMPDMQVNYHGEVFTTNRWGMRDQDYSRSKQPGTYRIGLLGASTPMGRGVSDDETFEAVLERRLNDELRDPGFERFEILNFSVRSYNPLQQVVVLEDRALPFDIDAALYVAHSDDLVNSARLLANRAVADSPLPYPELAEFVAEARVGPDLGLREAERRMRPFGPRLVEFAYRKLVEIARANGVEPVYVFVPRLGGEQGVRQLVDLARASGFTVYNLADVYGPKGEGWLDLRLEANDHHPNAKGHRLLADAFFESFVEGDRLRITGERP